MAVRSPDPDVPIYPRKLTFAADNSYVSYPENKSTENAVVILTDIFGHEFINAQL